MKIMCNALVHQSISAVASQCLVRLCAGAPAKLFLLWGNKLTGRRGGSLYRRANEDDEGAALDFVDVAGVVALHRVNIADIFWILIRGIYQ